MAKEEMSNAFEENMDERQIWAEDTETAMPFIRPKDLCIADRDGYISLALINLNRDKVKLIDNDEIIELSLGGRLFGKERTKDGEKYTEYYYISMDDESNTTKFSPLILNSNHYNGLKNKSQDSDIYLGKGIVNAMAKNNSFSNKQINLMNKVLERVCGVGYELGFDYKPKRFINDNRNLPCPLDYILSIEDTLNGIKNNEKTTDNILPGADICCLFRDF